MRGVADQHQPLRRHPRGMVEAEWVARTRRSVAELAQKSAHLLFRLRQKGAVGQFEHRRTIGTLDRPDDRRAVADLVVGQRQQREGTGRIEDLERDIFMGAFMVEGTDDRGMIILPARHRDPGGLARRRVAPLRRDQQRRTDHVAGIQRHGHAGGAALDMGGARLHAQVDAVRRHCGLMDRGAQQLVLEHRAERTVIGVGNEVKRPRLQPVADPDVPDRAALAREPCPDADRIQHPPAGAGHRRGAAVEAGRQRDRRIGGVDDDRVEPMRGKPDPQGRTHQTAAQDDDVAVHASLYLPQRSATTPLP